MILVGISEIKRHDLAEPDEIPLVNRLVETVELFGLLDYLLGYLVAFYSLINRHSALNGASRRELYHEKGDKGDPEQCGNHQQKSFQDVVFHAEKNLEKMNYIHDPMKKSESQKCTSKVYIRLHH